MDSLSVHRGRLPASALSVLRGGRAKELRIPVSVRIASPVEVLFAPVLKPEPLYSRELSERVPLGYKANQYSRERRAAGFTGIAGRTPAGWS